MKIDLLEKQARLEDTCRGCGGSKSSGEGACIVCWNCWRREDLPFKYYQGGLSEWLKELKGYCLDCKLVHKKERIGRSGQ